MTERPKFFDDLAGVAGGALSAFSGLRDELTALVRARVDETIRMLDLVRREEFDAMAELATGAKTAAESLAARLEKLESLVVPAAPREIEVPIAAVPQEPDASSHGPAQDANSPT